MPIRPENKHRYPDNWTEIREQRLQQANNRCENCGVINHAWGYRDENGDFCQLVRSDLMAEGYTKTPFDYITDEGKQVKVIEIVLTIAHLDHTPENNGPENLRAWCQKCHLDYDSVHHQQQRALNRMKDLEKAGQSCLEI